MLFKYIESNVDIADAEFDLIYPPCIKSASYIHFTPIEIAKLSAYYLANRKGTKVLDIGSGAGKFCMIGSACTDGHFVGVELRKNLCTTARQISKRFNLNNVQFINKNIVNVAFQNYEAFYFYNSFYENNTFQGRIDNKIELSKELFGYYSDYVKQQLDSMPLGTKLVTYYSFLKEVPESYTVLFSSFDDKLKFWEKTA